MAEEFELPEWLAVGKQLVYVSRGVGNYVGNTVTVTKHLKTMVILSDGSRVPVNSARTRDALVSDNVLLFGQYHMYYPIDSPEVERRKRAFARAEEAHKVTLAANEWKARNTVQSALKLRNVIDAFLKWEEDNAQ